MDAVTLSAIVFITCMTGLNYFTSALIKRGWTLLLGIAISIANFLQFGYFADLWPFTVAGLLYAAATIGIIIVAAFMALRDARKE
jgi:hypothetical protein